MRPIEPLPYLPRAEPPPAPPRASGSFGGTAGGSTTAITVLPRSHVTAGLPFMAQFLAQEIVGTEEPPSRWRERDNAYRLAGEAADPARLTILI